jgi:hypothetical protein
MANWITTDSPEAQEKTVARLLWRAVGGAGYSDAGNVREYNDATNRTTVTASKSRNGARFVGLEQVDVNHEAYTFLLDERNAEQNKLIQLARAESNREQPATEGAAASLENVTPGRWHSIGANGIANVTVTGALAGDLDEGTDYQLDRQAGRLFVIDGGGVSSGEDLVVTFDEPAIAFEVQTTQRQPMFRCDVIIEETNQFHNIPLRRLTFTGYLSVTEFASQTGEVAAYRAKVTPDGPVAVDKRPRYETIPVLADDVAAQSSSSSSQSSSATSASSSSSTAQSQTSSSHSSTSQTSQSSNSSSSTAASNTSSSVELSHSSQSPSSQSRTDSSASSQSSSSSSTSSSTSSAAETTSSSGAEVHYRYIDANIYVTRGAGYEVGDIIYIPGGVYDEQAGVTVIGVDPNGGIISYQLFPEGDYSVTPGDGDFNLTGGHGTGAKALNVYWETFTP